MVRGVKTQGLTTAEKLVGRLKLRLRNHVLWDTLLLFFPPLLVALFLVAYLYHAGWMGGITFATLALTALGMGGLVLIIRCRALAPSSLVTAALMDQHAQAKDRFLTLTTIDSSSWSASFIARLHQEAVAFSNRIELKRGFPYRVKRSFLWSLASSLVAAVLMYWLLPLAYSTTPLLAVQTDLRQLAETMMQRPRLFELARELRALVDKLEDPSVSPLEKQARMEELKKKIKEEQSSQQQQENHELLGQAASALQGLEQQQGNGQNRQMDQKKAGGGLQSHVPQEGPGTGKQSETSGGDRQGGLKDQLNEKMQQGKSTQGDPKVPGKEETQRGQGDGKSDRPDPDGPDKEKNQRTAGKTQGGPEERVGKNSRSEDNPQGGPPAERFYQAGEQGKQGIKGARYVTVQLPEEIVAESKGQRSATKEYRGNRNPAPVPISNKPLPAHVPDAPREKQQMPLEYHKIIR